MNNDKYEALDQSDLFWLKFNPKTAIVYGNPSVEDIKYTKNKLNINNSNSGSSSNGLEINLEVLLKAEDNIGF